MIPAQKCAWPAGADQSAKQTTQRRDFTPDQKRLTTLRAKSAKAGVQLHVYDDEDTQKTVYIVSRWALTRQLESLDAAEKWLDMVTGVNHG